MPLTDEEALKVDRELVRVLFLATLIYDAGTYTSTTQTRVEQIKERVREVRKMLNLPHS